VWDDIPFVNEIPSDQDNLLRFFVAAFPTLKTFCIFAKNTQIRVAVLQNHVLSSPQPLSKPSCCLTLSLYRSWHIDNLEILRRTLFMALFAFLQKHSFTPTASTCLGMSLSC
jgi:hypothetical protein